VRETLTQAERAAAPQRKASLEQLAAQLDRDAGRSGDGAKVRKLASVVRELAAKV
jgi:hypothetical protein